MKYELSFWGYVDRKYKINHDTIESAEAEARRVLATLPNRRAHPAVIYDERRVVSSVA